VDALRDMSFVFMCLEGPDQEAHRGKARRVRLSFIDVGMGVYLSDGRAGGILRVTTSTLAQRGHLCKRGAFSDSDTRNEYATNIQIAE